MSRESVQFAEMVREAHARQQIAEQAIRRGVSFTLRCLTCGTTTTHRDLRLDSVHYSVCVGCRRITTVEG